MVELRLGEPLAVHGVLPPYFRVSPEVLALKAPHGGHEGLTERHGESDRASREAPLLPP